MASPIKNNEEPSTSTMDCDTNNAEESQELLPGYTSITDFSQFVLKATVQAIKASNDLPTGDDYEYYSTYDSVRTVENEEARRVLQIIQDLMRHQNIKGTISGTDHALELDEQFDVIMDVNDQLLERVANGVDEATGVKKKEEKLIVAAVSRPNPAVASWNKKLGATGSSSPMQLATSKSITRPQQSFQDKVDNSNKPFIPIIRHKPNAKKSLHDSLQMPPDVTLEDTESPDFLYPHPYRFELDDWQPSPEQLERVTPQEPKPVDSTQLDYIDAVADLSDLVDMLKKEKEIAVDLEHHSYRSFQGITCLMQISTRSLDIIIDTLALRSDMHRLNEVFTDPDITKVFHGADSDMHWLQRDFGLYVVNMFDTGQAARLLSCQRFSLAYLLQVYCQVEADKQLQMSDWRIRPLPDKMIRYAREDTHYLLYIYDRMRSELVERGNELNNLLTAVYSRSKNLCLKVYKKFILTPESHLDLYEKSKKMFNVQQLYALKELYAWRDYVGREEDESVHYVLPNHMMLQIAEILPRERQGVLACCNPLPPLVRQGQHELHSIILQAREATAAQLEEKKVVFEPSPLQHPLYHTSGLTCHHDWSKARKDQQAPVTGEIPRKAGSSSFHEKVHIPLKRRPILFPLDPDSCQPSTAAVKASKKVYTSLLNPFLMFVPKEEDAPAENVLKPSALIKTWRLKPSAVSVNKRKSDVDLNTFAPEFAPPAKKQHLKKGKAKPTTTTTTKAAESTHTTSVSGSSPEPSSSATTTTTTTPSTTSTKDKKSPLEREKGKKKENAGPAEERGVLSSRQMMKKKKKDKKLRKKAFVTDSPTPSPEPPSTPPPHPFVPSQPPLVPQKDRKPQASLPSPQSKEEKKKKKKKKRENLTAALAAELEARAATTTMMKASAAASVDENEGGEEKKKKKKRSKKKGKVEEVVVENVKPFDYASADKSTVTGKMKKKIHADVYNPHFRGDRKKQKKGKKERFGAKQRKSISFKADAGAGKRT